MVAWERPHGAGEERLSEPLSIASRRGSESETKGGILPASFGDDLAMLILGVAIIAAPLALGSSGIWPRFVLEAGLGIAIVAWAVAGNRSLWRTAPPLAIAGLAMLQLMPVPDWLLVKIAPVSAGAWKVAHAGVRSAWGSISVDPAATQAAIHRLLLGMATVALVADLARYKQYRKLLLLALGGSGLVMLCLGLFFGGATKDYVMLGFVNLKGPIVPPHSPIIMPTETSGVGIPEWILIGNQRYRVDAGMVGNGMGSYIYSNHFAGGLCLTLPILASAWMAITPRAIPAAGRWLVAAGLFSLAVWIVAGPAHSRAGTLALVSACLAFIAIAASARWLRLVAAIGLTVASALVAGTLAVFCFGLDTNFLVSLLPAEWQDSVRAMLVDTRSVASQVAFRMFRASPVLGTGLDTYQEIFPRFYADRFTLFFAHNDYAQLLAEAGAVGGAAILWLGALLARKCWFFCRHAKAEYRLMNAGVWAAVAGIAIHSAFDWNMHLPANGLLACAVIGLALSSVPIAPSKTWFGRLAEARVPEQFPRLVLIGATLVAICFLGRDAISEATQRQLREAIVADRLHAKDAKNPAAADKLIDSIEAGKRMRPWDASNPSLALLLGQASLHLTQGMADGPDREALEAAAEEWFERARRLCPTSRGIPEQAPPASQK